MGRVAAIGESVRVQGLALAGVLVLPGDDAEQARASWSALPTDVDVVILTPPASDALGDRPFRAAHGRDAAMTAVRTRSTRRSARPPGGRRCSSGPAPTRARARRRGRRCRSDARRRPAQRPTRSSPRPGPRERPTPTRCSPPSGPGPSARREGSCWRRSAVADEHVRQAARDAVCAPARGRPLPLAHRDPAQSGRRGPSDRGRWSASSARGGIVAEAAGRRVEYSLDGLADDVMDRLTARSRRALVVMTGIDASPVGTPRAAWSASTDPSSRSRAWPAWRCPRWSNSGTCGCPGSSWPSRRTSPPCRRTSTRAASHPETSPSALGEPLSAALGPALLGGVFDGLLRPLLGAGTWLAPGAAPAAPDTRLWAFEPRVAEGDAGRCRSRARRWSGADGPLELRILVPPGASGRVDLVAAPGRYDADATLAVVAGDAGAHDPALAGAPAPPAPRPDRRRRAARHRAARARPALPGRARQHRSRAGRLRHRQDRPAPAGRQVVHRRRHRLRRVRRARQRDGRRRGRARRSSSTRAPAAAWRSARSSSRTRRTCR